MGRTIRIPVVYNFNTNESIGHAVIDENGIMTITVRTTPLIEHLDELVNTDQIKAVSIGIEYKAKG